MTKTVQITLESGQDDVVVVHLTGRLDFAAAPAVREALAAAISGGQRRLVVDLGAIQFVDSAGLGALIYATRKARQVGGDLCIVDPRDRVRMLMTLTALDQIIHLYASLDEALGIVSSDEPPPLLNLRVPATAEGMDILHQSLATCWTALAMSRKVEPRWREAFTLAVAEVAANIIQYAHPPEAASPQFALSLTPYADRMTAHFVDWGSAVDALEDAAAMSSMTEAGNHLRDHGRGLAIIRMTTDHFEYQRTAEGENHWLVEKAFDPKPMQADATKSPGAGQ